MSQIRFCPVDPDCTGFSINFLGDKSSPPSALKSLLDLGESVTRHLGTVNHEGRETAYVAEVDERFTNDIMSLHSKAREEFALELDSPFEGTELIAGAVWHGNLIDPARCDALVTLKWSPMCSALPAHTHDYSDRLIFIPGGFGSFYTGISKPGSRLDISLPLSTGSLVAFSRGVKHTFGTQESGMEMLSYHVPFVSLENPRQYTVLSPQWLPSSGD